ncbi:MAG: response regulator [Lachnospiraceae bacterium]|nr:response regulator [Lachnospiraceae bacterium]
MSENKEAKKTYWVIVVDDDVTTLKAIGHVLSEDGIRVTALNCGKALFDYVQKEGCPDLILLDIMMPGMDGFAVLESMREFEKESSLPELPVVFLTADDKKETENRGFSIGALDFIRKPVEPGVLVHRIRNILNNEQKIQVLSEKASEDRLTGLLNKAGANLQVKKACRDYRGSLIILDLDNFKLVNDIYGHEAGDRLLILFAEILKNCTREVDTVGRIGGDEFIAFLVGTDELATVKKTIRRIGDMMRKQAQEILGEDFSIPLGVSAGAVIVKGNGEDYNELFNLADKALLTVKQNGKHDCYVWGEEAALSKAGNENAQNIHTYSMILDERRVTGQALFLGQDAFAGIYRYMMRYIRRYHEDAYKVLLTVIPTDENLPEEEFTEIVEDVGEVLRTTLRNSDVMTLISREQFFLFLPMVSRLDISKVVDRILRAWGKAEHAERANLEYQAEAVTFADADRVTDSRAKQKIILVDDDNTGLKMMEHILTEAGYEITLINSGQMLLDHISAGERADLILLDVMMPEMDGFETMQRLRGSERKGEEIPVIFMTGGEDTESETKGLKLGAIDFIRKPVEAEVLTLRVKMNLQLIDLQRNLAAEVDKKNDENEQMFVQLVLSLADAIDAKDTYTNGHSGRVAKYAREIAKRYGYSERAQNDIYMIGTLHDVGKIGVPDGVINKPARLSEDEFALIKTHPVKGAKILENIKNMPKLAYGARWHHERYGGGGYPDGIEGDEIPEEARIIAVADAYDAMTSNRSYRKALPQEVVRGEILKGKGTQFDPAFADIMIEMIDEDTEYSMREK